LFPRLNGRKGGSVNRRNMALGGVLRRSVIRLLKRRLKAVVVVYLPGFVSGMADNDESKNKMSLISAHGRRRVWYVTRPLSAEDRRAGAMAIIEIQDLLLVSFPWFRSRGVRPYGRPRRRYPASSKHALHEE
jgi:hypothetical protein